MLHLSLRQSLLLWGISSLLIVFWAFLGRFTPADEQLLLKGFDGVYLQQSAQNYLFFDEAALPLWSPNGRWVALQGENSFYVADAASRIHYELDLNEQERYIYRAVWSVDSQNIALVMEDRLEGNFRLLIIDCLTWQLSNYGFPSEDAVLLWWENLETLRFVTVTDEQIHAWRYVLGEAESELLQTWHFRTYRVRNAALNPDQQSFILPALTPTLQNFELYHFDVDGHIRNISNRATHNDTNPIWSPDGRRLAYRASGDSSQFVILQEQGELEMIIGRFDNAYLSDMQWHDNQTLSMVSSYSGSSSVCALDILSAETQCSLPGTAYSSISWRPR